MNLREEDFPDVVGALRTRAARDRLPRPLRDGVLRRLSPERTAGWTAQLSAAALILGALVVLVALPWRGEPSSTPAGAQDAQRLEDLRREIVRVKEEVRRLEEEIVRLRRPTPPPPPAELPAARVTAVASEIGLVVLSLGKEDGVVEKDRYWVYRDGTFVALVVIDRTDAKWSAGKVTFKVSDPKVGDHATRSK